MKKIITIQNINLLFYNLRDNFNVRYIRSAPKCHHCNMSMLEWKLLTHCPNCGQKLERFDNVKIYQKGRFIFDGELYQYRNKNVSDFFPIKDVVYIKKDENEWFVFNNI